MTTIATLAVKLIADATGYMTTLDQAEKKAQAWSQNVSSKLKSAGGSMMNFGQSMSLGVTTPLALAGLAAINMASDMEESTNAVNVMFGKSAEIIHQFGKISATEAGLATAEFNQLAAVTGAFLTNLGYDQAAAAKETVNLTQRASDMASTFNTDVATALAAIQSGLKGEFNPLEQFGVKMNMAGINAKVLQMGLVETTVDLTKLNGLMIDSERVTEELRVATAWYGEESLQAREKAQQLAEIQQKIEEVMAGSTSEITDNARAQAALALIYEQTSKIQGDFKNTSEGLANSTRIMRAELTNAGAALGQQLLPYAIQFVNFARDLLTRFQALSPEHQKWIMGLLVAAAVIGPLVMIIGGLVSAIGAIVGVIGAITMPMLIVVGVILLIIGAIYLLYLAWTNNWGGIQEKTAVVIAFIQGLIAQGMQFIEDLTSGRLGALSKLWNNTWESVMMIVNTAIENFKLLFQAFQAAWNGDWYRFGELLRQIWDNNWKVLGTILSNAWENFKIIFSTAVKNIIDFFKNTDWGAVGRAIIDGISNGIKNGSSAIANAAMAAAKAALAAVKGFLGIQSPSSVFETQVGWQMAAGTALGWEQGLARMFAPTFGGLTPAPAMIPSGVGVAPSGNATGGININVNVVSDGVTDERDVARKIWSAVEVILRERGLA